MATKVLIIDDNIVAALGIEAEAERFGLEAVIACNPKTALQAARLADFAAAFVDVSLQEAFDGLEVARALVKHAGTQVVIVTAHAEAELAGRMEGLEGALVLSKPTDYAVLQDFLQSVADGAVV